MKKLIPALVAVAAVFAAAPAMAQVYGSLGYTNVGVDDDETGIDVNVGLATGRIGYKFTPNIGVEGEASLGLGGDTVEIEGIEVDVNITHEAAAFVVGFLPISDQFEVLARVGYGVIGVEAEAEGESFEDSASGALYGVGAQFFPLPNHGIRVDYTGSGMDTSGSMWSIAYAFRF